MVIVLWSHTFLPSLFTFISSWGRPESELWRGLAAFARERKLLQRAPCECFNILPGGCSHGSDLLRWSGYILYSLVCGSDCASLNQLFEVWCQASCIVSRAPFGCFDLLPNCLEMSSLKDKVNTVSGVVPKAGWMGSWEGNRRDGKTLVVLGDQSLSQKQRLSEYKSFLYTQHFFGYPWTLSNSCYQICHILFMSCGVPGCNKKSKAPNHHSGIRKDKLVITAPFLKNS